MGEILKNAYEKAEEVKNTNEYRFLAQMYTEIYAEKEALKSKLRQAWQEIEELQSKINKLTKGN